MSAKFTIIKGEDRVLPLDIIKKSNTNIKRPFDLTGWTKLTIQLLKFNNGTLEIDSVPAHGRVSTGTYEGVIYSAEEVGVLGDSITLTFDGLEDIATVISDWNALNPSNRVESDAEDSAIVPVAGTITLSNGLDDYAKVTVVGDARDGKIQVRLDNEDTNSLKNGPGQGVMVIIDFGDHDLGNRRIASVKSVINVESESL